MSLRAASLISDVLFSEVDERTVLWGGHQREEEQEKEELDGHRR